MSDQYLGEIRLFAGNYAPMGWAFCNGQRLNISQYEALYSLIGTTYGGDGQTTFALPDLRGRVPIGMGANPDTGTQYMIGQTGGTETVKLTENHLPAHTHTVAATSLAGTLPSPSNAFFASSSVKQYSTSSTTTSKMDTVVLGGSGGNDDHDNMAPFRALTYIISLEGIYPSKG